MINFGQKTGIDCHSFAQKLGMLTYKLKYLYLFVFWQNREEKNKGKPKGPFHVDSAWCTSTVPGLKMGMENDTIWIERKGLENGTYPYQRIQAVPPLPQGWW